MVNAFALLVASQRVQDLDVQQTVSRRARCDQVPAQTDLAFYFSTEVVEKIEWRPQKRGAVLLVVEQIGLTIKIPLLPSASIALLLFVLRKLLLAPFCGRPELETTQKSKSILASLIPPTHEPAVCCATAPVCVHGTGLRLVAASCGPRRKNIVRQFDAA